MATKLRDLLVKEISLVDKPANPAARVLLFKRAEESAEKAEWSTAFVNDLPDSSFAHISAGGEKDGDGRTTPRSLRHLPYKDAQGKPDAAHVRNALARLEQTDITAEAKTAARRKLAAAAKEMGIEVAEKTIKKMDLVACMRMCLDCCVQCLAAISAGTATAEDLRRCCQMCCTCCMCCLACMETAPASMAQMELHLRALDEESEAVAKAGKRLSAASMGKIKAAMDALHALIGEMEEGEDDKAAGGKTQKRSGLVKLWDILKDAFARAGYDPEKELPAQNPAPAAAPQPDPQVAAVVKQMEDVAKALAAATAENAALKKRLDTAEEERQAREFESRAARFPLFPGSAAEKAGLLRKAYAVGEADGKALEQSMASVQEAMSKNNALLTELGRAQAPVDANSPDAILDRMAKEMVSKAGGKLNYAAAYDAVTRTAEGNELLKAALKRGGTN